jgi:hypothetical protein
VPVFLVSCGLLAEGRGLRRREQELDAVHSRASDEINRAFKTRILTTAFLSKDGGGASQRRYSLQSGQRSRRNVAARSGEAGKGRQGELERMPGACCRGGQAVR